MSHSDLTGHSLGWMRVWEGAQPGQPTPPEGYSIPYDLVFCSKTGHGGICQRLLFLGHWLCVGQPVSSDCIFHDLFFFALSYFLFLFAL